MKRSRRALLLQGTASALVACGALTNVSAQTYQYDAHGRLTKVTYPGGQVVEYTYDAAGNRIQVARVNGPPTATLVASPTSISSGGSSTLTWTTTNATSASIDNGVGAISPVGGGFVVRSPIVNTTYTITATGPGGQTTAQATVTVTGSTFTQTIQITGSGPVNLRSLANAAGYNGAQNASVTFEVGAGVTITGDGGAEAQDGGVAIDSGAWPTGSYVIALTLIVKTGGKVFGGGGGGGAGSTLEAYNNPGGKGGDAIYCRLPMTVTVQSGAEVKGGGQGGLGGAPYDPNPFDENPAYGEGGGGGGGAPNGAGGSSGSLPDGATSGANGTVAGGGAGGVGSGNGTAGGNGGSFGQFGASGGYAVRKNGHTVTVTNNGAIVGTVG